MLDLQCLQLYPQSRLLPDTWSRIVFQFLARRQRTLPIERLVAAMHADADLGGGGSGEVGRDDRYTDNGEVDMNASSAVSSAAGVATAAFASGINHAPAASKSEAGTDDGGFCPCLSNTPVPVPVGMDHFQVVAHATRASSHSVAQASEGEMSDAASSHGAASASSSSLPGFAFLMPASQAAHATPELAAATLAMNGLRPSLVEQQMGLD
jgi:hypothetical protein